MCIDYIQTLHLFYIGAHTFTDLGFGDGILKSINHGYLRTAEHIFKGPLRLLESQDPIEDYEKSKANFIVKTVTLKFNYLLL